MGWLSSTSWSTSDTPVLATVLNNIGLDIRTWGANVDAGAARLTNCAGVDGIAGTTFQTSFSVKTGGVERMIIQVGGRSLFAAGSEPYAVGMKYSAAGGAVYIGASDATSTPDVVISAATGSEIVRFRNSGQIKHASTPVYADNAAAIAGGLTAGTMYRTSTGDLREVY